MNFPLIVCAAVLGVTYVATDAESCKNRTNVLFVCCSPGFRDLKHRVDTMEKDLQTQQSKVDALKKALVFKHGKSSGDKIFVTNGQEANYKDAYTTCSEAGGQLVSPKNEDENKAVVDLALPSGKKPFLGINDLKTEGEFVYPDGEAVNYTNWMREEPNNHNGTEDCVEMFEDGKWNDRSCEEKRLTVCEFA